MPLLKNDDPMYRLLRDGNIETFNSEKEKATKVDLSDCDFRSVDLKGMNAAGVDFSGCYFRQADLRGVDFSEANLRGASINGSKVSGAYFPKQLTALEIELSLIHGTRMRYDEKA